MRVCWVPKDDMDAEMWQDEIAIDPGFGTYLGSNEGS